MERLTPKAVEHTLKKQITDVVFKSPLSCGGKCCPVDEKAEKFLILVENAIQSVPEQKRSLIHEIAHVHFGVEWTVDGNVTSLLPENIIEAEMVEFIQKHPVFVDDLFNTLNNN